MFELCWNCGHASCRCRLKETMNQGTCGFWCPLRCLAVLPMPRVARWRRWRSGKVAGRKRKLMESIWGKL